MILILVEGEDGPIFFEHVIYQILQRPRSQVRILSGGGIDTMLARNLPDACTLKNQYTKVIAIFDTDKMHEPHNKTETRIACLRKLCNSYSQLGGFPVREKLEDLIKACLPVDKRNDFRDKRQESKKVAVKWALKQHLDESILEAKVADLKRSLNCQLQRDF